MEPRVASLERSVSKLFDISRNNSEDIAALKQIAQSAKETQERTEESINKLISATESFGEFLSEMKGGWRWLKNALKVIAVLLAIIGALEGLSHAAKISHNVKNSFNHIPFISMHQDQRQYANQSGVNERGFEYYATR